MSDHLIDCEYKIITIDSASSTYIDNTKQNFYIKDYVNVMFVLFFIIK